MDISRGRQPAHKSKSRSDASHAKAGNSTKRPPLESVNAFGGSLPVRRGSVSPAAVSVELTCGIRIDPPERTAVGAEVWDHSPGVCICHSFSAAIHGAASQHAAAGLSLKPPRRLSAANPNAAVLSPCWGLHEDNRLEDAASATPMWHRLARCPLWCLAGWAAALDDWVCDRY